MQYDLVDDPAVPLVRRGVDQLPVAEPVDGGRGYPALGDTPQVHGHAGVHRPNAPVNLLKFIGIHVILQHGPLKIDMKPSTQCRCYQCTKDYCLSRLCLKGHLVS